MTFFSTTNHQPASLYRGLTFRRFAMSGSWIDDDVVHLPPFLSYGRSSGTNGLWVIPG